MEAGQYWPAPTEHVLAIPRGLLRKLFALLKFYFETPKLQLKPSSESLKSLFEVVGNIGVGKVVIGLDNLVTDILNCPPQRLTPVIIRHCCHCFSLLLSRRWTEIPCAAVRAAIRHNARTT